MKTSEVEVDFFVLGAQKAGTSTLHELFNAEDYIAVPENKETHYFSTGIDEGKELSWYYNQFQNIAEMAPKVIGEVDPDYLAHPKAALNIKKQFKSPKFVVLIREPIARSYSHYLMSCKRNVEKRCFLDALIADSNTDTSSECNHHFAHHSYLSRSRYRKQIENYKLLFPTSDFKFVNFDDFVDVSKGSAEYRDILKFLNVETSIDYGSMFGVFNKANKNNYDMFGGVLWDRSKYRSLRVALKYILPNRVRGLIFANLNKIKFQRNSKKKLVELDYTEIPVSIRDVVFQEYAYLESLGLCCNKWRSNWSNSYDKS